MKLDITINGAERPVELREDRSKPGRYVYSEGANQGQADIEQVEPGVFSLLIDSRSFEVSIEEGGDCCVVAVDGNRHEVRVQDPRRPTRRSSKLEASGPREVTSPMPGKVVRVAAAEGDTVEVGQALVVIEAMKMQNEITSPKAGIVAKITVAEGGAVGAGECMVVIE